MRPVDRGDAPLDIEGKPVSFKTYADARDDLISRIGDYCSYCESPLLNPAVEHIQPKNKEPGLETSWSNFLLACTFCNSIKNDKTVNSANLNQYFWPDLDNTARAFIYRQDRAPQADTKLDPELQQIAYSTLELTGLDREPTHPLLSKKDRRWIKRNEAWNKAKRAKANLEQLPEEAMRSQIIDTAIHTGFWSIWMNIFENDADMRHCLIAAFPGTSVCCFDENANLFPRTGGQI
jgi:uncharacterized protein (TIGR02646 family)